MAQPSGTIKVDNKNLLNDLLFDNNGQNIYTRPTYLLNDDPYLQPISDLDDTRRIYAETPTFAKEEEDIYRLVSC
jgi:hypothetical protein